MILGLSGSLRRSSLNTAALRAAAGAAARSGVTVEVSDAVRRLPHFDPDIEPNPPEPALRFRASCSASAGVLLAVPEYAHGIPGALKNALDWTVGDGSLYRKPVAVLSVAPTWRGVHVRHALELVFEAMGAEATFHSVPVAIADVDERGKIDDPRIHEALGAVVLELRRRAAG